MASSGGLRSGAVENASFHNVGLTSGGGTVLQDLGFALRRYPAHTHLVQQGDEESRTFFIRSGWGSLHRDLSSGERQIVDFVLAGDVVGPHPGAGEAQSSFVSITELIVFEARVELDGSTPRRSELATFLLAAAQRHEAILAEHLTNLGRRNALVRTAHLLVELGARLELAGCADSGGYECPLTQYDLADALGLTAIHVNRMLRELREFGLLSLRKGRVEFLDLPRLIDFAQFDRGYILDCGRSQFSTHR